jgi:Flp pilus assembly protein TadG
MLWMTSRFSSDRGAVAIIVAMLFGFGVVIACAALTIDVGRINVDRRQLQNGADAAALSAARDCITSVCPSPAGSTQAQTNYARLVLLANNNAADGATKLARVDSNLAVDATDPLAVCGTLPGLPSCPVETNSSKLQECPVSPFPTARYVRVYTQTLNASRTATLLPYSFGAALAGGGTGANQQACAAVAVGPPADGPVLPITFSACEWLRDTGGGTGGTNYAPPPPYATPPPSSTIAYEVKILLADPKISGGTACKTWLGHDLPGGFGWVTSSTNCSATINALSWMDVSTGNTVSDGSCKTVIPTYLNKTVHLPVFDCLDPDGVLAIPPATCPETTVNGTHAWYHVEALAAFHITGWQLNGMTDSPPLNPANQCDTGATCIYGWFFNEVDESGGIGGGSSNLGLVNMLVAG